MDKSSTWYTRKEENAQFGYAVELAELGSGVVIFSAPGNPSFKLNKLPGKRLKALFRHHLTALELIC